MDIYSSDISNKAANSFVKCCTEGNIENAIEIYYHNLSPIRQLNKSKFIDILFNGFLFACINGHMDIVTWIFGMKVVQLDANDHLAFRISCRRNQLSVVRWFLSLGLYKYNVDILDKKITAYSLLSDKGNKCYFLIMHFPFTFCNTKEFQKRINDGVFNEECPVCYEKFEIILGNCNHGICVSCFLDYYCVKKKINLCTICKTSFKLDDCIMVLNE
jgi:hypothetical protein